MASKIIKLKEEIIMDLVEVPYDITKNVDIKRYMAINYADNSWTWDTFEAYGYAYLMRKEGYHFRRSYFKKFMDKGIKIEIELLQGSELYYLF